MDAFHLLPYNDLYCLMLNSRCGSYPLEYPSPLLSPYNDLQCLMLFQQVLHMITVSQLPHVLAFTGTCTLSSTTCQSSQPSSFTDASTACTHTFACLGASPSAASNSDRNRPLPLSPYNDLQCLMLCQQLLDMITVSQLPQCTCSRSCQGRWAISSSTLQPLQHHQHPAIITELTADLIISCKLHGEEGGGGSVQSVLVSAPLRNIGSIGRVIAWHNCHKGSTTHGTAGPSKTSNQCTVGAS